MKFEHQRSRPERPKPIEIEDTDVVEAQEIAPPARPEEEFEINVELSLADATERAKRAFMLEAKFVNTKERLEKTPALTFEEVATRLFEHAGGAKKELREYEKRVPELKEKLLIIFGSDAEVFETVILRDWERVNRATAFFDLLDEAAEEIKREPSNEFAATLLARHAALSARIDYLRGDKEEALEDITTYLHEVLKRDTKLLGADREILARGFTAELRRLSEVSEALDAVIYKGETKPREAAFTNMERFDDPELGSARERIERLLETYGVREIFSRTVATLAFEDRTRDLSAYNIAGTAYGEYGYAKETIRLLKSADWERPQALELPSGAQKILHEWAHSTDPTFRGLLYSEKSSSNTMEELISDTRFIAEWERVIKKDPKEVTGYIAAIARAEDPRGEKNPPEARFREDWAESMSLFLVVPWLLQKNSQQRYRFCLAWAKENIPDYTLKKHLGGLELARQRRKALAL